MRCAAARHLSLAETDHAAIAVPLRPTVEGCGALSFLGTPVDVTRSELFVEAFLPTDAAMVDALRGLAAGQDARPLSS